MTSPHVGKRGSAKGAGASAERRFFAVPIDAIDYQTLQMDLYLRFEGKQHTLYRESGVPFTNADAHRLAELGVKFLYVPAQQHGAYRRTLTDRMTRCFKDPGVPPAERGRLIRSSCNRLIQEAMLMAGATEPVEAVAEVSRTFAAWSVDDPKVFSYLMDMSAHDFGTATHMVNVGVACGLLARELIPGDDALFQVAVQGGMLHDIGKRGIPEVLLNKEGKLSPEEWRLFSAHPTRGYEELRKNPSIPEAVLSMVRDHHERLDGGGYPRGLRGVGVSLAARICSVADVFDAISATRSYRGATPPVETIRIMSEGRHGHFDARIFDGFTGLVRRMLDADPTRGLAAPDPEPGALSLDAFIPSAPSEVMGRARPRDGASSLWKDERRTHKRYPCNSTAKSTFHHQGKPLPVAPGESFNANILDIGRGGLRVRSPWPMSIGDTLTVELSGRDGLRVSCLARVVRVRRHEAGGWIAGLSFAQVMGQAADAA